MLVKHSLYYLIMKSGAGLVGLLSILIFTRLLSPDEYGIYAMLLSGLSICYAIFFQWLSLGLGRFYAIERAQLGKLISTISYGFCLASFFSLFVWGVVVLFVKDISWHKWLFFLPPLVISYSWFELNLRIANANLDPRLYGFISFTKASLGLLIGVLLYIRFGLNGIFGGIIFSACAVPFFWMRSTWKLIDVNLIDQEILTKFLSYGLPLAITISLTLVVDTSDRFLIAVMMSKKHAGLYSASYDLVVQTMGFIVAALYLAAFPVLVKDVEAKDSKKIKLGLSRYGTLLIAVSIPLLIIFVALSSNIANIVFGMPFRASATKIIPIIAFGIFIGSFKVYFFDLAFQLNLKTWNQILPALLTALVNLGLNLLWIPSYGIIGSAYATLVAFSMGLVSSALMANRIAPLQYSAIDLLKILVSGTCMYLFLTLLEPFKGLGGLVLQIILGVVFYMALLFTLNVAEGRAWTLRYFSKKI